MFSLLFGFIYAVDNHARPTLIAPAQKTSASCEQNFEQFSKQQHLGRRVQCTVTVSRVKFSVRELSRPLRVWLQSLGKCVRSATSRQRCSSQPGVD